MIFAPGSFLWLVAHDLRLSMSRTRALFGKSRPTTIALIVIGILALFHVFAFPAASWFTDAAETPDENPYYYPVLASAALFVLPWMMAQALTNARDVYSRRNEATCIWVVPSHMIVSSTPEDMGPFFEPSNDKMYRHPTFYKTPGATFE